MWVYEPLSRRYRRAIVRPTDNAKMASPWLPVLTARPLAQPLEVRWTWNLPLRLKPEDKWVGLLGEDWGCVHQLSVQSPGLSSFPGTLFPNCSGPVGPGNAKPLPPVPGTRVPSPVWAQCPRKLGHPSAPASSGMATRKALFITFKKNYTVISIWRHEVYRSLKLLHVLRREKDNWVSWKLKLKCTRPMRSTLKPWACRSLITHPFTYKNCISHSTSEGDKSSLECNLVGHLGYKGWILNKHLMFIHQQKLQFCSSLLDGGWLP